MYASASNQFCTPVQTQQPATNKPIARALAIVGSCLLAAALTACGGGGGGGSGTAGGTTTPTGPTVAAVQVAPGDPTTFAGTTVQFKATASYSDGSTKDVTTSANWASSNAGVASGPSNGLVTPTAAGSTNITAALNGVTSSSTTLKVLAGTESVLYSFGSTASDGANPIPTLTQASDGNFYGTTVIGGANGNGTVFKITPSGTETVLYSFGAGTDGANPYGRPIPASDGNFYGTTYYGGTNGNGTVFKLTPTGMETVIYSFGAGPDGANPPASAIQASDGNFYGETANPNISPVVRRDAGRGYAPLVSAMLRWMRGPGWGGG